MQEYIINWDVRVLNVPVYFALNVLGIVTHLGYNYSIELTRKDNTIPNAYNPHACQCGNNCMWLWNMECRHVQSSLLLTRDNNAESSVLYNYTYLVLLSDKTNANVIQTQGLIQGGCRGDAPPQGFQLPPKHIITLLHPSPALDKRAPLPQVSAIINFVPSRT